MTRIRRTLFPALTTTKQTQECPDYCDSSCPYNCYSFPDYYFPPPPPPISDADRSSPGNLQISSYLIILASLFTVIFVLVGFYVIKAKCYGDWCGGRDNGYGTSPSDSSDEEFLHENPIWLIATIGLQQSIINSITVCKYRKGEGLIEGTECSVCLSEFQEDETLRLLPKCNHAFHIPCIDTWLRSHTNCPLCRASIVSNNVSPEGAISNLASMEENANSAGRNQDTQMDRDDGEFVNNNMLVIASGVSENRDGTGEAGEAQELADESISKESANVDGNHVVQVLSDEIQLQEEIRSVSMDFRLNGSRCPGSGVGNSCTRKPESNLVDQIQDETEPHAVNLVKKDDDYSTLLKTVRRSSIAQCLHISPVSMKRSFSCSGRIVSSRGYVQKSKSKSSILGISINTRCTYSVP